MARHASVPDRTTADALTELSERHEVRVRGRDRTVVFIADSHDGRLIIRQEQEGKKSKDICAITLSNSDELRAFFQGLRTLLERWPNLLRRLPLDLGNMSMKSAMP